MPGPARLLKAKRDARAAALRVARDVRAKRLKQGRENRDTLAANTRDVRAARLARAAGLEGQPSRVTRQGMRPQQGTSSGSTPTWETRQAPQGSSTVVVPSGIRPSTPISFQNPTPQVRVATFAAPVSSPSAVSPLTSSPSSRPSPLTSSPSSPSSPLTPSQSTQSSPPWAFSSSPPKSPSGVAQMDTNDDDEPRNWVSQGLNASDLLGPMDLSDDNDEFNWNGAPSFSLVKKNASHRLKGRARRGRSSRVPRTRHKSTVKPTKTSKRSKSVRFGENKRIPTGAVLRRLIGQQLGKNHKVVEIRRTTIIHPQKSCKLHVLAKDLKTQSLKGFEGKWELDHHRISLLPLAKIKVNTPKDWTVLHAKTKGWKSYRLAE